MGKIITELTEGTEGENELEGRGIKSAIYPTTVLGGSFNSSRIFSERQTGKSFAS